MLKTTRFMFAAAFGLAMSALPALAKDWSTIRFATEGAYKPWNFKDASGKLQGYEIDLVNDVCRRLKATCTIAETPFDGMIPALNADKFDVIAASISITPKRKEAIAFSRAYTNSARTFFVSPRSKLQSLDTGMELVDLSAIGEPQKAALEKLRTALKGKSVGVQVKTALETFLDKYLAGVVDVKTYDTQENVDLDLDAGRIDLAIANTSYTLPAIKDGKKFKLIGPRFVGDVFGEGQGFGIRKTDTALQAKLDEALNAALADGTLRKLSLQWFGFDATPEK